MAKQDDRTEKPTPRRRKDARRKGTVAQSKEVPVALSLLAAILGVQLIGPAAANSLRDQTTLLLGTAGVHTELPRELLRDATVDMLAILPAFLGLAVLAGLVAGVGQVGLLFATEAVKPKLTNMSPKRGLERLKPGPALWELVRSSLKLGLLTLLLLGPVRAWMDAIGVRKNLEGTLGDARAQLMGILWRVVLLAAVIAVADYAWNRWRTTKQLRMSKQDVKREHREQEGDPLIRSARRQRALAMSRNRMITAVRDADVLVTNPTHFAVALKYEPETAAPKVTAKGADKLALRMRREAYRCGVTVTEDKPLARELYRRCKPGQHVPAALYEAVALVLAVAYRRRPHLWRQLVAGTAARGAAPANAGGVT